MTNPPSAEVGYATTHDGHRLFYRKVGNGPQATIIPIDLFTFDGLTALARRDRTLIFYDPRNRGMSDSVKDLSSVSVENDLRDIDAIRRHHHLQQFNLIGYSVYGLEVGLYGSEHPEQIRRIVQLGPVALKSGTAYAKEFDNTSDDSVFNKDLWSELQKLREAHSDETNPLDYSHKAWEYLGPGLVTTPEALNRLQSTIIRMRDLKNEWPINFRRHVGAHFSSVSNLVVEWSLLRDRITFPVLVIHGLRDRNVPYGAGREWASRLPDARLLTVENAAHQSWVDEPELVLSAIDEFLEGHWPKKAQKVLDSSMNVRV